MTTMTLTALVVILPEARGASVNPANAQYGTDTSTRLFENFEGVTQAADSSGATFGAGYLGGSALRFTDTGGYAQYSDSWWVRDADDMQESGTIECFVKIDTFLVTSNQYYPTILTEQQHPISSGDDGRPEFGFNADGAYFAISDPPGYLELDPSYSLNPGQWYHLAATWGAAGRRLFVNGLQVASHARDTFVFVDTFFIGSPPSGALQRGLGIVGVIDRFRLSDRQRSADEFPSPLDIVIDTPTAGGAYTVPLLMTFRAFATETRSRLVDIYADTDGMNFNGVVVARNLPESGTFFVGGGLATDTYFLYAVAHAGSDSAYASISLPFQLTLAPGVAAIVAPADTTATIVVAPVTTDSFTVVLLTNGGTTSGSLVAAADSIGTAANYFVATRLMNAYDTAAISIWTRETAPAILIGLRSDTASLKGASLPYGIPNTAAGRSAFGATVISLEFLTSNGRMIGDTKSTSYIGDSFAYTIEYRLSAATTRAYHDFGFDTAPGSSSFRLYYADTYGAGWIHDTTTAVVVVAGVGGGITVRVTGITRDLPGGLGLAPSGFVFISGQEKSGLCLLQDAGAPGWLLTACRFLRDILMQCGFGRLMTLMYYACSARF